MEEPLSAAMFDRSRLTVTFTEGTTPAGPLSPRRYTLTHSDRSGALFLTIGADFDRRALHSLQVRLMRDEVLGEWIHGDDREPRLELHMAAQGGVPLFGTADARVRIFRSYRSLVLSALACGDAGLLAGHPELTQAPVVAVFQGRRGREEREDWGRLEQYRPKGPR
jgi:Staygreen protein